MRLLADIGGTNARFALADADGGVRPLGTLPVNGHATFLDALKAATADCAAPIRGAAVAAAGPRDGQTIRLTNAGWTIDAREIAAALGGPVRLFNDLEAVALALPYLAADAMAVLRAGAPRERAPRLAFNIGTGFGAAVALNVGGRWTALGGEAGHMRFAWTTDEEARLAAEATVYEDLLSGRGYQRLTRLIPDPAARRRVFSELIGRVAGDLVAAVGAWGGVYFCGGVLDAWDEYVDFTRLAARFDDKGPMRPRLEATPILRLTAPAPALTGLAHANLPEHCA